MSKLLYPPMGRTAELLDELIGLFVQLPFVYQIISFGSHARHQYDRWSDIDLIVVTESAAQYPYVIDTLRQHKLVVHHNPLTPLQPFGAHFLGVVFEGDSVFHNLDLNFLSYADLQSPNALDRFGQLRELYLASNVPVFAAPETVPFMPPIVHADEKRIGDALHWTKKAVKKFLRHQGALTDIQSHNDALKLVMRDYPDGVILTNGDICRVAHTYIAIADLLLKQQET